MNLLFWPILIVFTGNIWEIISRKCLYFYKMNQISLLGYYVDFTPRSSKVPFNN